MNLDASVCSGHTWTTPQRRCYQRIKSGLTWHKDEILRFLTLGSAPGMIRDQQMAFRCIKESLRRKTLAKLYNEGYLSKRQLRSHYTGKPLGYVPQFQYINIRTTEGPEGVLHILYFGDFLPQSWLKDEWHRLTGGCQSAYIRMCKTRTYNEKRLARYCIDQYCAGQTDYLRFSCSKHWVYPGFVRHYNSLKVDCRDYSHAIGECYGHPVYRLDMDRLINRWNEWLLLHGSCSFHKFMGGVPVETELSLFEDINEVVN
ncbi:MAG: hypothetical protein JW840_00540 [Candidatus Thermoplasmatota archaeon]|nr:hypothetical protein [Candidatus Thermoplasmatota archaeon]